MKKKKRRGILFWMGTVFALAVCGMIGWSIADPKSVLKTFGWKDKVEVETVIVRKLVPGLLKKVITVKGRVQCYKEIIVTSQVSGEIKRIYCVEGKLVKKDQLLVEIDPKTLVEDLASTKSRLEQTKLSLETLKIRGEECKRKLERGESLFRKGLVSNEDIQTTRYSYDVNKSEIEKALWQIKEMEGEVASINKKLEQTKISSPMDGVVTKLMLGEGEGVIQGLVNTNGTAIMRISDMSQKGVTVWMSESDVPFLKVGQAVDITCPNFRNRLFKARLAQISMTGQVEQFTDLTKFEVKTIFIEPYPELLLEMSAVVSIEVDTKKNVLKIPLSAIQIEEKHGEDKNKDEGEKRRRRRPADDTSNISYQDFVFVIDKGNLSKQYITTGLTNEQEAEVIEGLSSDQLVVIGPTKSLIKLEIGKEIKWEEEGSEQSQPETGEKSIGKNNGNKPSASSNNGSGSTPKGESKSKSDKGAK